MNEAKTCEASFTLKQFDVSVLFGGPGDGTVSYAPGGGMCYSGPEYLIQQLAWTSSVCSNPCCCFSKKKV